MVADDDIYHTHSNGGSNAVSQMSMYITHDDTMNPIADNDTNELNLRHKVCPLTHFSSQFR